VSPVRTRWSIVALAFAAGIAGAMQVGKVPPALSVIRSELGLSLVAAGWVASLFNAIGAAAGMLTGVVADQLGRRRMVLLGLGALCIGSALGALAPTGGMLLFSRFLEGIGFIAVAVAAPALLTEAVRPADQRLVLGSFAVYMGTGMGAMMAVSPAVLSAFGWRGLWFGNAALLALLLVAIGWATAGMRTPSAGRRLAELGPVLARPGPWLLGAIFGCYTLQWMAVMAWLPSYALELGLGATGAAWAGAGAVVVNVTGVLAGGVLLHRGTPRWLLIVLALAAMGLSAVGFFSEALPAPLRYTLVALFSGIGGLLPAACLAAAPAHAPSPRDVGSVNGLINQGSNLGTLAGPPLMAALVTWTSGWSGAGPLLPVMALIGLCLAVLLRLVERRLAEQAHADDD
jgi:MFS family permease